MRHIDSSTFDDESDEPDILCENMIDTGSEDESGGELLFSLSNPLSDHSVRTKVAAI